ncbi:hypothetical protein N7468_003402 [Penicillium chermesinum]|uniref:Uncharacterized protein n=1 Tax=Penicillium chermesinum TaxID=63820 RepID=A0A9W9P902_9EURO|nr:uncharacterized protein N7468_003402 [Penicillium chermesinum]KAJ5238783.1 hypothetical protein N7468_003402 [Penicillium chermesinum]
MPCVTRIVSSVNPFKERLTGNRRAQNREMLRLQELFFACPNLRSFSIDVYGNYGGCVRKMPLFPRVLCFQLTGSETFPPLEHLSLDGYKFGVEEWPHWRQKFSWGNLRSLSLGPQKCEVVLSLIKTCTLNLKSLRVEKYSDNGPGDVLPDLESFLGSFNTLERLTVNGYSVSSAGISNHPNLKHFCMHTIEPFNSDTTRKTLEPMELYDLDINCPHLESLHLDIQRDGEWVSGMNSSVETYTDMEPSLSPEICLQLSPVDSKTFESCTSISSSASTSPPGMHYSALLQAKTPMPVL